MSACFSAGRPLGRQLVRPVFSQPPLRLPGVQPLIRVDTHLPGGIPDAPVRRFSVLKAMNVVIDLSRGPSGLGLRRA